MHDFLSGPRSWKPAEEITLLLEWGCTSADLRGNVCNRRRRWLETFKVRAGGGEAPVKKDLKLEKGRKIGLESAFPLPTLIHSGVLCLLRDEGGAAGRQNSNHLLSPCQIYWLDLWSSRKLTTAITGGKKAQETGGNPGQGSVIRLHLKWNYFRCRGRALDLRTVSYGPAWHSVPIAGAWTQTKHACARLCQVEGL